VSGKEIEAALAAKGVTIDRHKLELPEPIRALGSFEIPIKLGFEVIAKVKLEVVAEG
jgi:large subunit ribosomal protein L9